MAGEEGGAEEGAVVVGDEADSKTQDKGRVIDIHMYKLGTIVFSCLENFLVWTSS